MSHLPSSCRLFLCAVILTAGVPPSPSPGQERPGASAEQPRRPTSKIPAAVTAHRDIRYAEVRGFPLHLDLFLPGGESVDAATPPPLVVWIHGGGWSEGSKDACPITWMTGHGLAVASIQYRLSGQATFPAQIHDCKGAVRWLRARSDDYGFDPERIGAAGISAGGHLASLLGVSGGDGRLEGAVGGNRGHPSRVQSVLALCGTSDFLMILEDFPDYARRPNTKTALLFGGPIAQKRSLARLASPAHHVSRDDPPLLIFHGEEDAIVPPAQSARLAGRYRELGLKVERHLIPGAGHVPAQFWDDARRELILQFFTRHLKTAERKSAEPARPDGPGEGDPSSPGEGDPSSPAQDPTPAGLPFLQGIAAFRGFDLTITEARLKTAVDDRALFTRRNTTGRQTSYWVVAEEGENIIVMFGPEGGCQGIQRLRPIPPAHLEESIGKAAYEEWTQRQAALRAGRGPHP